MDRLRHIGPSSQCYSPIFHSPRSITLNLKKHLCILHLLLSGASAPEGNTITRRASPSNPILCMPPYRELDSLPSDPRKTILGLGDGCTWPGDRTLSPDVRMILGLVGILTLLTDDCV